MILILGLVIFSLIIGIIAIEVITKKLVDELPDSNKVTEEFPHIGQSDLDKFSSFDKELGWERQPNESRKKDTGHHRPDDEDGDTVVYSTDQFGSRVCDINRGEGKYSIATFGDSFCFCREVQDGETIQHYLSKELGVHVSNYGVGNYGPDQAFLRMQRRFEADSADYIVFILSDRTSIPRLGSMWKHYYEFGNTFAVKPKYKLEDGDMKLIPTPINNREEILRLEEYSEVLRKHDYHYEHWFKQHHVKSPYAQYWFENWLNLPHAMIVLAEYTLRDNAYFGPLHQYIEPIKDDIRTKKRRCLAPKIWQYRTRLEVEFADLFCELMQEYSKFARKHDATPILLPVRHSGWERSEFNVDPLGDSLLNEVRNTAPELHIVDPREELVNQVDAISQLYTGKEPSLGHPSPLSNRLNAIHLASFIRSHRRDQNESVTSNSDSESKSVD